MKLVSTIAALFLLPSVSAFAPANPTSRQSTAVCSTRDGYKDQFKNRERDQANYVTAQNTPKNQFPYVATASESCELSYDPSAFPKNLPLQQIQGGNSRLTWKMPQGADRLQMLIQTNGRPLKARVELWLGPIRRVHFVDIACMNGAETPFRACLKFKNTDSAGPQTLEISTSEDSAFPALVGVDVMTKDRSVERQEAFDAIWKASTKMYSQGDKTVRSIPIADHVKSVQLLVWSKDVGKKSFKANIELLQGPNTKRQYYELQCGGGTQPYHAIFETPGNGWTMRWTNTKTLHDGSHEFVVVPYELESDAPTDAIDVTPMYSGGYADKNNEFGYGETLGPHGSRSAPFTGNGQVGRL